MYERSRMASSSEVPEEHRQIELRGAALRASGDVGEERVADIKDKQRHASGPLGFELPGGVIADEAELVDGGMHASDGGRCHFVRGVQDVGHGADGDRCGGGNVAHTSCHLHPSRTLVRSSTIPSNGPPPRPRGQS